MKRRDLLKKFHENGWWLLDEGSRHTKYTNGKDIEEIPRHRDIKENLAKSIISRRGLK